MKIEICFSKQTSLSDVFIFKFITGLNIMFVLILYLNLFIFFLAFLKYLKVHR